MEWRDYSQASVVDKPGFADEYGQGHVRSSFDFRDGGEGGRIKKFDIIQARSRLVLHYFFHCKPELGGSFGSGIFLQLSANSADGPPKNPGLGATISLQIFVSRTHGYAIGLAEDWGDVNFYVEIQVSHHTFYDRGLLIIFCSKDGNLRGDNIEEFGDDSGHSAEMGWARFAFHALRKGFFGHVGAEGSAAIFRVHLVVGRGENDVDTSGTAESDVAFQVPRVARKIFLRTELGGINIDADDDFAIGTDDAASMFYEA